MLRATFYFVAKHSYIIQAITLLQPLRYDHNKYVTYFRLKLSLFIKHGISLINKVSF